jgi:hypothetical protein
MVIAANVVVNLYEYLLQHILGLHSITGVSHANAE